MARNKKEPKIMLTHQELFDYYQQHLGWINRRLEPETLKFYKETAENWTHAKEILFYTYEDLRYFVADGIPEYSKSFFYDNDLVKDIPPIIYENEHKCPAIGILKYRDAEYPIYNDDYGMQDFVIINGREIAVDSCGGNVDWYYEIDRVLDKIDE